MGLAGIGGGNEADVLRGCVRLAAHVFNHRARAKQPQTRVLRAAEMAFHERRRSLSFSTNSTDVFLTDTTTTNGTTRMFVFHTDLNLILRGTAAGSDTDHLEAVPIDNDTVTAFRNALLTWDGFLPGMLGRR